MYKLHCVFLSLILLILSGCATKTIQNYNLGNPTSWVFHKSEKEVHDAIYSIADTQEERVGDDPLRVYKDGLWRILYKDRGFFLYARHHKSPYHVPKDTEYSLISGYKGLVSIAFKINLIPIDDQKTRVDFEKVLYWADTVMKRRLIAPFIPHGKNKIIVERLPTSTFFEYSFLHKLGEILNEKGMPPLIDDPDGIRTRFNEKRDKELIEKFSKDRCGESCLDDCTDMEESHDYVIALRCIDKYISDNPDKRKGYYFRSLANYRMGYFNQALNDINTGLEIIEKKERWLENKCLFLRGRICAKLGEKYQVQANNDFKLFNKLSKGDTTALHQAILYGDIDLAGYLVKNGADVNAHKKSEYFKTPFCQAILKNNFEMVKLLVENGANLENEQCADIQSLKDWECSRRLIEYISNALKEKGLYKELLKEQENDCRTSRLHGSLPLALQAP